MEGTFPHTSIHKRRRDIAGISFEGDLFHGSSKTSIGYLVRAHACCAECPMFEAPSFPLLPSTCPPSRKRIPSMMLGV